MQPYLAGLLVFASVLAPRASQKALLPPWTPHGEAVSSACRAAIDETILTLTHARPGETRLLDGFGAISWLSGGPFQMSIVPCTAKGKVINAGWSWYHPSHDLNLYVPRGSVRHASLSASGKTALLCVAGADGATYCKTLPQLPTGFGVLYYNAHPSVIFDDDYSERGNAVYIKNRSLKYFRVSESGPAPPP